VCLCVLILYDRDSDFRFCLGLFLLFALVLVLLRLRVTDTRCQEVDVGLAADIGTLARLPKITGNQSLARELAYTARTFSSAEAEKLGLVSRVIGAIEGRPGSERETVVDAALNLAKEITSKSPVAVRGTKHLMLHSRDHGCVPSLYNGMGLRKKNIVYCLAFPKTSNIPQLGTRRCSRPP
jgi:enoyl-CoA hydratase/carnithine racemase